MENKNNKEYYTIDLLHIVKYLWKKVWIIAIAGIRAAVLALSFATFFVKPTYSSSILVYVNNSSFSLGNTSLSISASDISASQSLVKTYREFLMNRTTLEMVIEEAEVPYTYKELYEMVSASPVNETEIMRVTVVSEDPYEAAKIANCIAEVLPKRIEIIEGASMEILDAAIPNLDKIAPSRIKYTLVGFALGVLLAVAILVIFAMMDDTIHDEEHILRNYEYPILAKIPDLMNSGGKSYRYYYQNQSKSKADNANKVK